MTDLEIRPVGPDETEVHEVLGRITASAYAEVEDDLGDYVDELADVAGRARGEGCDVLVAIADGRVVGGVTYVPDHTSPHAEHDVPEAASIRHLAVAPEAWGRGIGRALVETCLARAREAGVPEVVLHSTPAMTTAHGLYARLGFRRDADLDIHDDWGSLLGFRLPLVGA